MSKVDSLETAWEGAREYFLKRRAVIFISYCRFWERHGFVQQALAKKLARAGVQVVWFDGADWRPYRPVVLDAVDTLRVSQLPQLPLRRFPLFARWDRKGKAAYLRQWIRKLGGDPLIWVEAGMDEGVAGELPYVDVFSVFDDPYRHQAGGPLCNKAKVIVCQNRTAGKALSALHGEKTFVVKPPVDMTDSTMGGTAEVFLPPGFPEKVMGYVGTFFSDGFDLPLFELFIQTFPDWGFVMMGRTDAGGMAAIARFKQYKNFHYFPWVPRNQVASVWKQIDLTLLFYKENRTQDGAFPVKIVEGLRFGVPCIATAVPKTADLEGIFPRSSNPDELIKGVETALAMPPEKIQSLYQEFASEMDPKRHLTRVAQWVQQQRQ